MIFSTNRIYPLVLWGARDQLRGVAYELAMILTSEEYLIGLFQEEAQWVQCEVLE